MTCQELDLQPILEQSPSRTAQENMRRIMDWAKSICAELESLQAGVDAIVPGGADTLSLLIADYPLIKTGPSEIGLDPTAALDNNARVTVRVDSGGDAGTRRRINFIPDGNVSISASDDATDEEVDVTISGGATPLDDLERKFRLLLKAWLITELPPPPGLEDDYELALAQE